MIQNARNLQLDIFDYNGKKICSLYSSKSNASGQATGIIKTTQRNGWKEISFSLPQSMVGEKGKNVDNFRVGFLKADYRVRAIDDEGTDWFLVSEPKVTHNGKTKTYDVVCNHVSQLLKQKAMGLEFSDDNGNNIGTAGALLETILENTGWSCGNVAEFYEKDKKTLKVRSLKASAKTGAFKLISMMCDLFEAKPIYNGDTKTVDIVPMNPFSEPVNGSIPDLSLADTVLELRYGNNVSNISRTMNTENIVTCMYAYGAYGDTTNGYCSLQEAQHNKYYFNTVASVEAGKTYHLSYIDNVTGERFDLYFTALSKPEIGEKTLVYSDVDFASKMYIWDDTNKKAWPIINAKDITSGYSEYPSNSKESQIVQNWYPYVMDFDYYRSVGMLTDEMIQAIAEYQIYGAPISKEASQAMLEITKLSAELSEIIGSVEYMKLNEVEWKDELGKQEAVVKDKQNPVIYRTDYDSKPKDQFKVRACTRYDRDGDPIPGDYNYNPSVLYSIGEKDGIYKYDKSYVYSVDDEMKPTDIVLNKEPWKFEQMSDADNYLFKVQNINGYLGALEASDEACVTQLNKDTTRVTEDHPVFFEDHEPTSINEYIVYNYCWWYCYTTKRLFMYDNAGGNKYAWSELLVGFGNPPDMTDQQYFLSRDKSKLYYGFLKKDLSDKILYQEIQQACAKVYNACLTRDRYWKGVYKHNIYTVPAGQTLEPGNYYIEDDYENLYMFTTTKEYKGYETLDYVTGEGWKTGWVATLSDSVDESLNVVRRTYDTVMMYNAEPLRSFSVEKGGLDENGDKRPSYDSQDVCDCRTINFIKVIPNTTYRIDGIKTQTVLDTQTQIEIFYYDKINTLIKTFTFAPGYDYTEFKTPDKCVAIKLVSLRSADWDAGDIHNFLVNATMSVIRKEGEVYVGDGYGGYLVYKKLDPIAHMYEGKEEQHGIIPYIRKFTELSDKMYGEYVDRYMQLTKQIEELKTNMMNVLGDLYREGYWQDTSYVDGDEKKLYEDALQNLAEVSKPDSNYTLTFLDLYGAKQRDKIDNIIPLAKWQDISTRTAIHLLDEQIDVNCWAFVDTIKKCYDQPWRTTITVNTKLSTISQKSFTDVMTTIANVASEYKGKSTVYDNTSFSKYTNNLMLDGDQIMNGTLGSDKIGINEIKGVHIEDGAITSIQLGDASITTAKIQDAAIDNAKIKDASIDNAKIQDAAINTAKIQDAAITTALIHDAAIDSAKIRQAAITTALIAKGAVQTEQVADASITDAKIVELNANKITTGELDAAKIKVVNLSAENIDVKTINGHIVGDDTVGAETVTLKSYISSSVVISTKNYYASGESSTEPPKTGWSENYEPVDGEYLWQKTTTIYANGSQSTSAPICIVSAGGEGGSGLPGKPGQNAITIHVESSNGNMFKNTNEVTLLTAVIYSGKDRITTISEIRNLLGEDAHIQWLAKTHTSTEYVPLAQDDPKIYQNGFCLSVSAADIVSKTVYVCQLID